MNNILKIILAAGTSKRYGSRNKLLEKIKKKTIVEQTIINLLKAENDKNNIKIILGYEHQKIRNVVNRYGIKSIYNKYYKKGLGSSVSRIFEDNYIYQNGIMFIPGDMPLISPLDFKSLINTFMANNSKKIICPSYRGKEGNPLIIPKLYYKKIIDLKNDKGAKNNLPKSDFIYIPSSFGTVFDIDNKYHLNKARFIIANLNL